MNFNLFLGSQNVKKKLFKSTKKIQSLGEKFTLTSVIVANISEDYLKHRKQFVQIDENRRSEIDVVCGYVQANVDLKQKLR